MTGEQKPGGLEGEGLSATYRFAYESIRKGAPGLSDTTCMAIARSINMKVSIATIPSETRVRELERELAQANANGAAHWGRATAAEAKLARAVEVVRSIIKWGDSRCPCYNDLPDPCPLCDASVANLEGCKAAEKTFPPRLLADMRQTLAALQQEVE